MTTVLVAADKRDDEFWHSLTELTDKLLNTVHAHGKKLCARTEAPALIMCDMHSFEVVDSRQIIVLYKDPLEFTARLRGTGQTVAIVDSSNERLRSLVSSTQLPAITCGLLARDTVTLSSMDIDSAVIAVQRPIPCFDGTCFEPQEIPVRLARQIDSFVLMSAAAICVLSGNADALSVGKL